jgi:hypothetical protein
MALTPNEQLDQVLKCLAQASDYLEEQTIFILCNGYEASNYLQQTSDAERNVDRNSVYEILGKLVAESYAEKRNGPSALYRISFNGRVFISNGGYAQQGKDIKAERFRQTLATWMTAIGTAFAGLYGLKEVAVWLYHHLCHCY